MYLPAMTDKNDTKDKRVKETIMILILLKG
jgi:hypothetical protein